MTIKDKQQQRVREALLKYTLPDALRPQYDGMTAWELAGIILDSINPASERHANLCEHCGENEKALGEYFCAGCLEKEAQALSASKEN